MPLFILTEPDDHHVVRSFRFPAEEDDAVGPIVLHGQEFHTFLQPKAASFIMYRSMEAASFP